MTDPRTQPGYKQKYAADRVELLLGAILDELIKANAARVALPGEAPAPVPAAELLTRRVKIKPKAD